MSKKIRLITEERNLDTDMVIVVLSAPQRDGTACEIRIPRAHLGDSKKMRELLLNKGCLDFPDLREQLVELLEAVPLKTVKTTTVSGWYDNQLVTKYGTFPVSLKTPKSSTTQFDHSHSHYVGHQTAGKHALFLKKIKPILDKSNYLSFFLAAALAPALADRIGLSGAYGFNLSGKSSTGKTLTLRLCQSVYGRARDQDLSSFGNTTGYILDNLSAFGSICVPFTDPKATREKSKELCQKMQTIVFSASDGVQRQSLTKERALASRFFISLFNSERPLFEIFTEAGCKYEKGDMVRLIDIPVPTENGIFDRLDDDDDASEYAQDLEKIIESNYGVLFLKWVDFLVGQNVEELKDDFERDEKRFLDEANEYAVSSEEKRMAKAFALVAVAGHYGRKHKIIPKIELGHGDIALSLFQKACKRMSDSDAQNSNAMHEFNNFMKTTKNYPEVNLNQKVESSLAENGFKRKEGKEHFLYVKHDVFSSFFKNKNLLERIFYNYLQKNGALHKFKGGWTAPIEQKGLARQRYMKFALSKCDEIILNH